MTNENQGKGRMPDFKGTIDVAAWSNKDKDGKTFLSVVLGTRAKLFPVEKQQGEQGVEDIFE